MTGEVLLNHGAELVPLDVGSLIAEVKQGPQLEAWVGDGEVDRVRLREGSRLLEMGVLVDVEDAPDLVVREVLVVVAAL